MFVMIKDAPVTIKSVTAGSSGFTYLGIFGEYTSRWPAAPASSLGGYQMHCSPAGNDIHHRCDGFSDDPNWTAFLGYYR